MIKVLIWVFIAYGLTSIVVWGSIFENMRNWIVSKSLFFGKLVTCMLCFSTWVGFFLSVITGGLVGDHIQTIFPIEELNIFFRIFLDGMFTAGAVWAINSIIEFFEENRFNNG